MTPRSATSPLLPGKHDVRPPRAAIGAREPRGDGKLDEYELDPGDGLRGE